MRITTENVREVIQQVASASPMPSFRTQNRPIVNLLGQFASFYNSAHQPQWLLAVENYGKPPMQPFDKDDYLTLVLMSLVLGFETYAKAALWITGLLAGFADYPKRINRLPRGVSTVEYLFNVLPDEIHPDFPIKKADPEAAAFFASFYKNTRNSLFHGDQLASTGAYDLLCFLEWYRRGYEWIAGWRTLDVCVRFDGTYLRVEEQEPRGQEGLDQRRRALLLRRQAVQAEAEKSSSA
jgi:hypothetical protein